MLRSIALGYNVSRLILGAEKSKVVWEEGEEQCDDPSAARLCVILNAARAHWPASQPPIASDTQRPRGWLAPRGNWLR